MPGLNTIPTDADYNSPNRQVLSQIEIFLDGIDEEPLVVTRDGDLIDWELLEEVGSQFDVFPIGNTSSNTFNFTLINLKNKYSPTNPDGPYYGKIKKGIKVIPWIATANTEWVKMGEFFVDEWVATFASSQANVLCYDRLNTVFNDKRYALAPIIDCSYATAYEHLLQNVPHQVDANIDIAEGTKMSWWYILQSNIQTLQELQRATCAACYTNREGLVRVANMIGVKSLKSTISDQGPLLSSEMTQSIEKQYDGVLSFFNRTQLAALQELLNIRQFSVPVGDVLSDLFTLSGTPAAMVHNVKMDILASDNLASYRGHTLTPYDIRFTTRNDSMGPVSADLSIRGYPIEAIQTLLTSTGTQPLEYNNTYVQNALQGNHIAAMLERFVSNEPSIFEIRTVGNPLIVLTDKVRILSAKYALDINAYVISQTFHYSGGLSCDMQVLLSNVLEG